MESRIHHLTGNITQTLHSVFLIGWSGFCERNQSCDCSEHLAEYLKHFERFRAVNLHDMFSWHTAIFIPIILMWKQIQCKSNITENVCFFPIIGGSQYLNIILSKSTRWHTQTHCSMWIFTIFNHLSLRLSKTKGKVFLVLFCIIMQAI